MRFQVTLSAFLIATFGFYLASSPNFSNLSHYNETNQIDLCSEAPPTLGVHFKTECRDSYIKRGNNSKGPWEYLRASQENKRQITSIKELKIIEQNFENLGSFVEVIKNGEKTEQKIVEKPEIHKKNLALRIKKMNPDIIIAAEVKDIQAATEYAEKYLDGLYQAILIEGNDQRGIDVCFFIKKDLPFDIEVQSHRNTLQKAEAPGMLFSRDLPVISIRESGAPTTSEPLMILAAVHYKAQMPDPVKDQKALKKRAEQVKATIEILKEFKEKFPNSPILASGDFNNDIRNSPEFEPFFTNQFKDAMDVATDSPPKDKRGTQYFFFNENNPDKAGQLSNEQLDALMSDPNAQKYILSAGIQRDVNEKGEELPHPKTPEEVNERASDHDGIWAVIAFETLYLDAKKRR